MPFEALILNYQSTDASLMHIALLSSFSAPQVLDIVNEKIDALQATIRAAVVVLAIILFLVVAARNRLRLAPTLLAFVGAASIIWLAAGGGLEWFAGMLGREFSVALGSQDVGLFLVDGGVVSG